MKEVKLSSGRRLSYREFGNPNGEVIMFFHGFPGSSIQGKLFEQSRFVERYRVIAVDRPGFGKSEHYSKRQLTDFVNDLKELATTLNLDQIHLLGVSGGAPYAMATAALFSEKVRSLNLVCPLGPLYHFPVLCMLPVKAQFLLMAAKYLPALTGRVMQSALAGSSSKKKSDDSGSIFEKFAAALPQSDLAIMADTKVSGILSQSLDEAFSQGTQGPLHELKLFLTPWNFKFEQIKVPTNIFHGAEDSIVPCSIGKVLSNKIQGSKLKIIPNEGHYSLPVNHVDIVLDQIGN